MKEGKRPTSYLYRVVNFLVNWIELNGREYVKYGKIEVDSKGKRKFRIGVKCLDPSLSTDVLNKVKSAILMSGTLWNIEYYVEILGLDKFKTTSIQLPNPFPPENYLILVDRRVSTKYEKRNEEMWVKLADHLSKVINSVEGRVAVFFPSYEVLNQVLKSLNLAKHPYLIESTDTRISDVRKFLMEHERGIVIGVARGKISEGVDITFQGKSMISSVIIAGLPFPKKTEVHEKLLEYFKEKFGGKGFEYANVMPCVTALAQAAGRLIRSEFDRGVIVLMDSRSVGKFKEYLPKEWRSKMKSYFKIENLTEELKHFLKIEAITRDASHSKSN